MKKLISLLLVLATLLSCFVLTVSADETTVVSDEGRLPFEDVKNNHWFYQSVSFCYANEIIKGMDENTFGWNGNLTRAQFLQMLATVDGADLNGYQVSGFDDVKPNHWYYPAVAWAYETNLTSGVSPVKFAPNNAVSRAEICRFMMKYMENKFSIEVNEACLDGFSDINKIPGWANGGVKYAVSAGLISGMEMNGKLCVNPQGYTTRAQAAVIFKGFMENYFYGDCEHAFSEATCTEAAVCAKCGLVNGLPTGHTLFAYDCVTGGKCTICEAEVEPSKMLHNFVPATCTLPETCTRCHKTIGEAKGHRWNAATCTAPKTCTVCKATEGVANTHVWWAATCTNPKMCKLCYKTEGNALGHNFSGSTCVRCGKRTPYAEAVYNFRQTKPSKISSTTYASYSVYYMGAYGICYNTEKDDFGIFYGNYSDSGYYYATIVYLPKTGTQCRFEYISVNSSGNTSCHGIGYFDAKTYKLGDKLTFSSYESKSVSIESALSKAKIGVEMAIVEGHSDFLKECGVPLSDFGFVNCEW